MASYQVQYFIDNRVQHFTLKQLAWLMLAVAVPIRLQAPFVILKHRKVYKGINCVS